MSWLLLLFMNGYAVQIPVADEAQCHAAFEYVEEQVEEQGFNYALLYACVPIEENE